TIAVFMVLILPIVTCNSITAKSVKHNGPAVSRRCFPSRNLLFAGSPFRWGRRFCGTKPRLIVQKRKCCEGLPGAARRRRVGQRCGDEAILQFWSCQSGVSRLLFPFN